MAIVTIAQHAVRPRSSEGVAARVSLCGRLQLEWDGERLEEALPGRQGRLLFAYLALHRDRPVRRDELVEALWSDAAPSRGDALLRPVLSRLRSALGPERLDGRAELALRFPDDTWIDWEFAREALRRGRASYGAGEFEAGWEPARAALAVAERGLLAGLEGRWIEPFRAELEGKRVELLETVALIGARLGDVELPDAERAARRAVQASPYRESARIALMEVLRRRGNVAEALVAFDEIRTLLRDELGSSPGRPLLALHDELLRAEPAPPRPRRATPAPADRLPDRLAQALASPWVGRCSALGRLREEARRAAAGGPEIVVVSGDGGIGKTRLVAELATGLAEFDVLYGRCDEEELFPYGPWVDMLRPRLARLEDAELAEVVATGAVDLARLLPEIGDRLPDLAGAPAVGDPDTQRRQLFAAVADVVRRLARQRPLLVVVDDLHWADRSSLLLGRHLAGEPGLGPVLMVGTFRDTELHAGHPLPELLADLERHRAVRRLRLGGMDESEVAELIGSLHGSEVQPGTVQAIRAETDGNPFFVKHLVRHLEEAGDGGLHVDGGFGVPDGVRDVIARRVARLPEHAGQVLRVAALIGRDFELELLERVTDLSECVLLDVLDAAVRGALLTEVPSTPGRYSFAHALLRTTLESELSATRRARLHRRIGEAIEERHRDRLDPWLDELARHFGDAGPGEVERAVSYAVRAAEQAAGRLAYDEAVRHLSHAVALRERDDPADQGELARLRTALAAAESSAGHWQAARATFARAAAAARAADAPACFARAALGHSGGTWEQYGRLDTESVVLLDEALTRLPEADSPLRTQVRARLAVLLYYVDMPDERVLAIADDAVSMARRLDDVDALVAALAAAQYARWRPGRAHDRLVLADELIEATEARGMLAEAAEAHLWRALALLELCRLDDADVHLARHAELAESVQRYELLVHRDALRSMRALLEGDYEGGAAAAQEVLAWGEREEAHGRTPTPIHLQFYGAEMIASLNERDEMGALAPYLERLVREMGALPGWRTPLAWAYVQSGRADLARAELEAMSAHGFSVLPRDTNFLPALAIVAHAVGELGDAELASRVEPLLAPYAESWVVLGPGPSTLGPVAYCVGLLQLLQDWPGDAVASFELALERAQRMHARPYVARSRAGLAEALRRRAAPGDGARADELLALAAAGARELGMLRLQRELGLTAAH